MSMNLKARTKSGPIELWQTDTQISYTILPRSFGEVKGAKAREALERYMEWVELSINGAWESIEQADRHRQEVRIHLGYVRTFSNDKTLCVYVM